ncbi:SDR family NAD(P)-dependent oxidoreductase [Mesorhizobium muleiense]|uniref:SDR family NAD(P)-dependent oxidoreductase n=1 Tax=Mesorhizobium muleiense TaxID=1004279 RepID=UPI001F275A4B|nr:SDR family NAD(P)-dependent oxidoreductase [Mesorhizobium muleiense]MCF6112204.1 SDR family NAD(P)-dependent oxidoreductase [Mesorhizobium muleiense]
MKDKSTISRRTVLAGGAALATLATTRSGWAQAETGERPVVLITGTSSGFGRLMAEGFARGGAHVIAAMRQVSGRNAAAAEELRVLSGDGMAIDVVEIDVLSEQSVNAGVARAIENTGQIDVLVSNAGIVVPGPVELQTPADFASNIDTNMGGALRVYRAVVPHMRDQGQGTIIQMSSALGRAIDPMLGGYCASKLAVEAAADALAYEVAASNIEVSIVQPADAYPTRLQENAIRYWEEMLSRRDAADRAKLDVYAPHIEAMLAGLEPDRDLDPREVSDAVIHLASMPFGERPGRLTVGPYKDGIDPVNAAHDQLQNDMMEHNPIIGLLTLD